MLQSLNLGTIEIDATHGREGYQIISDKGPLTASMSIDTDCQNLFST
jgi:hypothetical protein